MRRLSDWKFSNQSFSAVFFCKSCERLVSFSIRFKEYYDRMDIRTSVTDMPVPKDEGDETETNSGN